MAYRILSGDTDAVTSSQAEMLRLVIALLESCEIVTVYKFIKINGDAEKEIDGFDLVKEGDFDACVTKALKNKKDDSQ